MVIGIGSGLWVQVCMWWWGLQEWEQVQVQVQQWQSALQSGPGCSRRWQWGWQQQILHLPSSWESSMSVGGLWVSMQQLAFVIGFKFQCTTWIRCAIHISILHMSYTNTKEHGTHHIVIGTSGWTPHWQHWCTVGVNALAWWTVSDVVVEVVQAS